MTENLEQIATRLKGLREIFDYSIQDVAGQIGVSEDFYQAVETGRVDIPVSVLYDVAHLFNVELTAILTGDAPRLHVYSLVKKGAGLSVDRNKPYKYQSLAYNFLHKKAEPFMVTVEPGDEPGEPYRNAHPGQEMNYVIEGSLKVVIDKHELILNEGDTLYFDASRPHGMMAQNGKPAKFIAVIVS